MKIRASQVVDASLTADDYQRNLVLSFLSGKQNPFGDYSSSSGEIVGILKQILDTSQKDSAEAAEKEEGAKAELLESYFTLMMVNLAAHMHRSARSKFFPSGSAAT